MKDFKRILFSLFLMLSGCVNGIDYVVHGGGVGETEEIIKYIVNDPNADIWIESFTQVDAYEEIDILWVLDGSCSMVAHQSNVLDGVKQMMGNLPVDINWRLKMITAGNGKYVTQSTTFPLTRGDTIGDAVTMYNQLPFDGGEEGFDAVQDYIFNDAYGATWLRADAALLVVFVSDEEEQSLMSVASFTSWASAIRPSTYLSFIGHVRDEDSVCDYGVGSQNTGLRYMEAVNHFGGTIVDICETDWSAGVTDATQNITPIEEWELYHTPYANTIVVFEDGRRMQKTEWNYNSVANIIEFLQPPAEGSLIEIGYAIEFYHLST